MKDLIPIIITFIVLFFVSAFFIEKQEIKNSERNLKNDENEKT